MMKSCNICGKTIIINKLGKTVVGCEHFPLTPMNEMYVPDFIKSIFGDLKPKL